MIETVQPLPQYLDTDGKPLNGGYVYFGISGQNPETSPIAVYWDLAATQPAAQPLRTSGGYIMRNGTPARVYVAGDHSVTVRDKKGRQVYSALYSTDLSVVLASTAAGNGAAMVGVQDAAGMVLASNAEDWLAALSDPQILVNANGADPTGAAESTTAIQACINTMAALANGGRVVLRGTYLVDTLTMRSNVTLDMTGGALLNFKAHATSHNPVIRIGDASASVSNAKILGGEIDGNSTAQTYASEEWSPGVFIWGSSDNVVEGCKIHNTRGDGVQIGYDSGRVVGSNRNRIENCEIYDQLAAAPRMSVSITYGNENRIVKNRCSGVIDLELNASVGECKNNLVFGNSGRIQTEALTAPRVSDLTISMASLNTDPLRYYGNTVIGNHCNFISLQYNKKSVIQGNVIVGSVSTQARLIDVAGCDDTIISGNQLDANVAVATSLTDIIRTRGCAVLAVKDNQVRGDAAGTRPFHNFVNTFAASTAADHIFTGNQTETGWYRNGACQQPTEKARFRVDQNSAGSLTATQISGVKCNLSISRSGSNMILSQVGNCGTQYIIQLDPQCNATTTAAANMTHSCSYTYTVSGSNRTVTVLTYAPAAGAVTLAAFNFAAAGNTGTFFVDVTF